MAPAIRCFALHSFAIPQTGNNLWGQRFVGLVLRFFRLVVGIHWHYFIGSFALFHWFGPNSLFDFGCAAWEWLVAVFQYFQMFNRI